MNRGQILPDTPFGCMLTTLALQSQFIVEIGTLTGEGSTVCLHNGMKKPDQRLVGIEVCKESALVAAKRYRHDNRVQIMHGTVVSPSNFPEFKSHPNPDGKKWWDAERYLVGDAPHIVEESFGKIDLLLIDGGEFGAYEEFLALKNKVRVIALDDSMTYKNARTRSQIMRSDEWTVMRDETDRNGWFVARRKQ